MKALLTFVLAIGMMASTAQNYIGLSGASVKAALDKRDLIYEEYYSDAGMLCYKYVDQDENVRIYIVSPMGVCHGYVVASNNDDFTFKMRGYLMKNGFTIDKKRTASGSIYTYRKGTLRANVSIYAEDEEKPSFAEGYSYVFGIFDSKYE